MEHRDLAKQIGRAARAARTAHGLSQADVAERLALSTEFYGRLERGATLPSVPTLHRLARTLGTSADALLGLSATRSRAVTKETKTEDRVLARRLGRATPSARRLIRLLLGAFEQAEGRARKSSRQAKR